MVLISTYLAPGRVPGSFNDYYITKSEGLSRLLSLFSHGNESAIIDNYWGVLYNNIRSGQNGALLRQHIM